MILEETLLLIKSNHRIGIKIHIKKKILVHLSTLLKGQLQVLLSNRIRHVKFLPLVGRYEDFYNVLE